MMKNILLTGATGFVGKAILLKLLQRADINVSVAVRARGLTAGGVFVVGNITGQTQWGRALLEQQVIIHTAARAHVMGEGLIDPLDEYRRVNVEGTLNLAKQAVNAGVKRFIFISSIKVNGEATQCGKPFLSTELPAPQDPYGLSKLEAEQGLMQLAAETSLEVVIIRPPLVYGPGVKGNFASMIKLIDKGIPLPLGAIHNRRSLVGIDNLVDLIVRCIDHPAAANQVFLAGDGEDLSTTQLLRSVAKAMGRPSRLIPVPAIVLQLGATVLGKKAVAQRLLGSLQVDISKTRHLLDWTPPVSVDEGLKRCFSISKD